MASLKGIGVDLLSLQRMKKVYARFGPRLAARILSEAEYLLYQGLEQDTERCLFLSKRFCIKEAVVKALGTGFREGISWKHMHIESNARGQPQLSCTGSVLTKAQALGIQKWHLSLSDERDHCIAFVIAEG